MEPTLEAESKTIKTVHDHMTQHTVPQGPEGG